MTGSIQFGSITIDYRIVRSNRKTLGITVTPEMEVVVRAPSNVSQEELSNHIRRKAPWIIRQKSYFLSFQPKTPPRKYISGETHLYLGRQYRLRILIAKKEEVKLRGKFLEVTCKEKAAARSLLKKWYLLHSKTRFPVIAKPFIDRFRKYNVEPSSLILRDMSSRWGSCTPKGKIILNPELIKAPKGCIEYVIIHELCHLVHPNHTNKFIELQSKEMPDWMKWKTRLEKLLA